MMAAAMANITCDPSSVRKLSCKTGDAITYAVNAARPRSVPRPSIIFATACNMCLVIRDTGQG